MLTLPLADMVWPEATEVLQLPTLRPTRKRQKYQSYSGYLQSGTAACRYGHQACSRLTIRWNKRYYQRRA